MEKTIAIDYYLYFVHKTIINHNGTIIMLWSSYTCLTCAIGYWLVNLQAWNTNRLTVSLLITLTYWVCSSSLIVVSRWKSFVFFSSHSSFLSLHLAGGLKSFYVQLYQWWQQIDFNRRKLARLIQCKIVLATVIMSCWINLIELLKVQKKKYSSFGFEHW